MLCYNHGSWIDVALGKGEVSFSESIPSACTYDSSDENEENFFCFTKDDGIEISDNTRNENPSQQPQNSPTEKGFQRNSELIAEMETKIEAGVTYGSIEQPHLFYYEYRRHKWFNIGRGDQRYIGQTKEIRWKKYVSHCKGLQYSGRESESTKEFEKNS